MHERVVFTGQAAKDVERLRGLCLAYPEAHEVEQFGHPWFKAGKRPFCIAGWEAEAGFATASFSTNKLDQEGLCGMDERFYPTPYMHQHGWTTLRLEPPVDWEMVEEILEGAYRHVALKRMLKALDQE